MFYKGFQVRDVSHEGITMQRTTCAIPRNSRDGVEVNHADKPIGRLPLAFADRLLHPPELHNHPVTLVH